MLRDLLKDLYDNHALPNLVDNWSIEKAKKTDLALCARCRSTSFLARRIRRCERHDTNCITRLKDKKYEQINVRTHDFVGPSYFILKGNQANPF